MPVGGSVSTFRSGKLLFDPVSSTFFYRAKEMNSGSILDAALKGSWPWYVAGPIIGLLVPALLLIGNRLFGVSSNLRHICSAVGGSKLDYLRYDWKRDGLWNMVFVAGVLCGSFLVSQIAPIHNADLSPRTREALRELGIQDFSGPTPKEIFNWKSLLTIRGFTIVVVGGFMVGFGTAYAGGCTSGHAISGLADFQLPSLIAVIAFFSGGVFCTFVIIPALLRL